MSASKNGILIDHFAFTFKGIYLRDCANYSSFNTDTTAKGLYKRLTESALFSKITWPEFPQFVEPHGLSSQDRDTALQDFQRSYQIALDMTLMVLFENFFGFKIGSSREKGMFGYKESYPLYDLETGQIQMGFIALGGNNDTIYTQLSGTGCKYLFAKRSPELLHNFLSGVLNISKIARIDLAYDCFEGNFDCDYALTAYDDGAFHNKGRPPALNHLKPRRGDVVEGETVYVGSRKSTVYWRVYNKALEQGLHDTVWFRSEVELKGVHIDALKHPASAFAGLCDFSASIAPDEHINVKFKTVQNTLDFAGKIRWAKTMVGKTLYDIAEHFDGDINLAYGALCDESGGKLGIPQTYMRLIKTNLENVRYG
ncbi:replication initiation factor domain-containing protein [Motilimonas pumila]|nr:replication initiation factor domain-containing protein [Motilimonas pumila]